jgi:hypothetical protein
MGVQQIEQFAPTGISERFEQQVGVIEARCHDRLYASNLLHEL